MALETEDFDFTGKIRLPLPKTFSGIPADWEEWSWNFKAYISMFDTTVKTFMENAEGRTVPIVDDDLQVTFDTGDVNDDATQKAVTFSRKLHYLLANLTSDAARLIVRQNFESNGFETWRLLHQKFALLDATRHVSLLTQLLDYKFNPATFESDFNTWETIKHRYERQVGSPLPDGVLVATLLNKTTGALQQHLRLNARTLQTYQQTRDTIVEYFRSKLILGANSGSSSSNNGPAPMDVGAMKGKGKKGGLWSKGKGKHKGGKGKKGKGKGKGLSSYHRSFAKGSKGKGGKPLGNKGKGKGLSSPQGKQCYKCGGIGHFERDCPSNRVSAVEENFEQTWTDEDWTSWEDFEGDWTVNAVSDGSWDFHDYYDDSWDYGYWDDSWDWYSYSDPLWESQEPAGSGTKGTLEQPSGSSSSTLQSPLPPQGSVSAVSAVNSRQSSTFEKGKAPTAKTSSMANVALFAAVMMSTVSRGSSLCVPTFGQNTGEDMFTGLVDFCPSRGYPTFDRLSKKACISPVVTFMNETVREKKDTLFSVENLGMSLNTNFHDLWLAEHLLASTTLDSEQWILFDSGASANCCPKDFGADWPLLPLNGEPPPLRSISGQPLHVYGRRLIRMKLDEVPVCFHFYVCEVPYPVISVARLLLQGYKVSMESPDACMLKIPDGREARIVRHGSLLFLCPQLDKFDEFSFAPLCNDFHAQFSAPAPPGLIAPTFNPVYYHADRWVLKGHTLIRLHPRARKTLFVPTGTKDRPLDIDTLASERVTEMTFSDGSKKTFTDDWRRSDDPCAKVDSFVGRTIFKLSSKPTGHRISGKTSTLSEPLRESKEARRPGVELSSRESRPGVDSSSRPVSLSVEDTFKESLNKAKEGSGTLEDLKSLVLQAVSDLDPSTGQPYVHDRWLTFPTAEVRVHHESRKTLFTPFEDQDFQAFDVDGARMTLIITEDGTTRWFFDDWHEQGDVELDKTFVGATCFCKSEMNIEDPVPLVDDTLAQKAKGVKAPGEPTDLEVLEHNLTHLPFRSWCKICVQSKSKQNPSRTLKTRQPVLQMDYSFIGDRPGEPQITLLNVVDVLSGLALSVVVPQKGQSVYAQAELRRFVLETGRTFGILQSDPEPALKQLAQTVTGQVGGLSWRTSPVGWKQAQGSVGNMQATLYAQIRTLTTDLKARYVDFGISVHDSLYPWIVRHAQWLINRYLQKADGLTAFEKRWNRKYHGSICNFGETIMFRVSNAGKSQLSWHEGIWLGRDTESDMHFVADSSGVFKTRSIRRNIPSQQAKLELLQSIKSTPWDPSGSKRETDAFILPLSKDEQQSQGAQEEDYEPSIAPEDQPEDFQDLPASGSDIALPQEGPSSRVRRHEEVSPDDDFVSRPRLDPSVTLDRKHEHESEEAGPGSKVQRLSGVLQHAAEFRISSVETKHGLEVPVSVNQDEKELLLTKNLENPYLWYETEFPKELEVEGMRKEMKSMVNFDVFAEVPVTQLNQDQLSSAISSKWVKTRKPDGSVRCRLVCRGFDQVVDDPDQTFASTPSLTTLKLLLTLAVTFGWNVFTGDISTAFLHALITGEDIFIIPPSEFYPDQNVVWKLKRALYGLKNSPRLWQDHFASVMKKLNFDRMKSDPNLYVHKTKRLYVLTYVDDLMFFGHRSDIDVVMTEMRKELLLKTTGQLSEGQEVHFLGPEIRRTSEAIELSMSPIYVEKIMETLEMQTCKSVTTPGVDILKKVTNSDQVSPEMHKLYRRVVGQLLWLSNLRCDIMYAVKELSKGLTGPTDDHFAKLKHLVKYLSGTKTFVQQLRPNVKLSTQHKGIDINCFVDSDWAGDPDSRKSTSGVSLFVLGVNITSHSRTQQSVALSSGEAELYAIGSGVADSLFVRSLVMESRLFSKANICVFTDSTAGKSMAGRFGTSRKTKHVGLRYLYVQELVQSGLIRLRKVLGTLNPADILTKYVSKDTLYRHLGTFGLIPK